jgi:hypothetical protein
MQLFLNVLSIMPDFQKRKNKGGKSTGLLSSLGVTSARLEEVFQQLGGTIATCLFSCKAVVSDKITGFWHMDDNVNFVYPGSSKLFVSHSRYPAVCYGTRCA